MKSITTASLMILALACAYTAQSAVIFDWATIGNPGNANDNVGNGYGGVDYTYRISKHEVTNVQYTQFLNAVDPTATNTLALYDTSMAGNWGGIDNTGTTDGARYVAQAGREQNPVNYVSFFDAMRFVNWLHNGQGAGGTESGVYDIGSGFDEIRSANAKYWIPSMDEWYKAAYYDPSGVYYDYPTGTNDEPYSDHPNSLNTPNNTNVANFYKDDAIANGYDDGYAVSGSASYPPSGNPLTDVGAYTLATSPYGTFDQGGNVAEYTDSVVHIVGGNHKRATRGGGWSSHSNFVSRNYYGYRLDGAYYLGFRVASVPEPSTILLGAFSSALLLLRQRERQSSK